jgi:hypothetical protein
MSSRGAGAALALIAAAFLAVSVATPTVLPGDLALFAGHPTVDGHTLRIKDVYVGLLDAQLCNTGGDGKCTSGVEQEKLGFRVAVYGELAATGLLAIAAIALAVLTIQKSERRKSAAKLVQFASALTIIGAAAMLIQGPFREATIPIGIGMPLYGTAVLGALIASLVAVRPPPPIKLRVGDRDSQPLPTRARAPRAEPDRPAEAFDVQQLFAEEPRRGDRGRESRRDARGRPAQAADDPAASSDPFGPPDTPVPDKPFPSSQLRPLYDAAPQQGGTGGLLPIERPALPFSPPAPVARSPHNAPGVAVPPPLRGEADARNAPPSHPARAKPSSIPPPVAAPPGASPSSSVAGLSPGTLPPPMSPGTLPPPSMSAGPLPPGSMLPGSMPPPTPPPIITLPANAPTVIATPIDPSAAAAGGPAFAPSAQMPAPMVPTPIGPSMIALPVPARSQITEVASVPPMPENDLPIGPPTAVMTTDGSPVSGDSPIHVDPTLFPRPETPLAPPPPPVGSGPRGKHDSNAQRPRRTSQPPPPPRPRRESHAPPRPHRESQVPPPRLEAQQPPFGSHSPPALFENEAVPSQPPRESQSAPHSPLLATHIQPAHPPQAQPPPTPARPLRAAIPMPARPARSGPSQPPPLPPSSSAPNRIPPPRTTISTTVPPPPSNLIPAIPAIPPIPSLPKRAGPATDPPPTTGDVGDIDQATISRVPIEITDNASPTNVSYDMPTGDEITTTADDSLAEHNAPSSVRAGAGDTAAAHLRATVPFTVPDTQPTPERIASIDSGPRAAPDPDGEAVTVAARSRNREPASTAPPPRDRAMPKLPISTAPDSLPPPKDNKQQASGPSPACPQCESPMAWVEEHLRFYCKSCRMYF